MRRLFLLSLLIALAYSKIIQASEYKYAVADIPKALLKNAKAVVRNENISIEVNTDGSLKQKVTFAITILNKNGKGNGLFFHEYDKSMKVSGLKARIYDESGKELRLRDGINIRDFALVSESTIYSDMRAKAINPDQLEYPYTVVYEYEVNFVEVIQFPEWKPVDDYNLSVQHSYFSLTINKPVNCRIFQNNITNEPFTAETNDIIKWEWRLTNFEALTDEDFNPSLEEISPLVKISPNQVEMEDFKGRLDTWEGFAAFINELNKGRNNLPDETREKVKQLVSGFTSDRDKIKALYEYMQNKTRYVNVKIGIGGYQPFDASVVDRLSYGDCKALANYMKTLLEVAGIKSIYTLVNAGGENDLIWEGFPSNQFNHIILCVPLTNDTVWLECTNQRMPFNYLGTFTDNRYVLLTGVEGGKLAKTPVLTGKDNLESHKINVVLDAMGGGEVNAANTYNGYAYENMLPILYSDQEDRKRLIIKKIQIPSFELNSFDLSEKKTEIPSATEKLSLQVKNYTTMVVEKIMLPMNLMNRFEESPFSADERKYEIVFKWPIYEVDTIVYHLPEGYKLENVPAAVALSSEFARYNSEVDKSGSTVTYIRKFELFNARYPKERYEEIVDFFEKIVKADACKVILTRM